MERIDVFREALKERVCGICFDRKDDGTCGLPEGRTCAIEAHLPGIVKAIEACESFDLTPYVKVLNALDRRDALFYHFDRNAERPDTRPLAPLPLLPILGLEWKF